ncbi:MULTISPECIES: hypothetical protein [unclassified Nodularia (in: cyanobacteria)]|uniref:hypothetical protein n=1 Tax=unclassified Nodularia (in: cyanobacteria) TaxID=2656917 RepID=UPI001880A96A|nr:MULTISPECIES: hypothetical protein [unclassified Nodularia (in: cyanobacteria)]MBE9200109.1 hypothetical protein [Nodularia sp. LEGE 06071]MCC2694001.1 hypothetical protein [Nodularia sp. LEGE 04288]
MKSNQISVERQPEESLWREIMDEESEKLRGGALGLGSEIPITSLLDQFDSLLPGFRQKVEVLRYPRVIYDLDTLDDRITPR